MPTAAPYNSPHPPRPRGQRRSPLATVCQYIVSVLSRGPAAVLPGLLPLGARSRHLGRDIEASAALASPALPGAGHLDHARARRDLELLDVRIARRVPQLQARRHVVRLLLLLLLLSVIAIPVQAGTVIAVEGRWAAVGLLYRLDVRVLVVLVAREGSRGGDARGCLEALGGALTDGLENVAGHAGRGAVVLMMAHDVLEAVKTVGAAHALHEDRGALGTAAHDVAHALAVLAASDGRQ